MGYNYQPGFGVVAEYKPPFIHQGNFPAYSDSQPIEKGQVLKAGSVLGRKAASGKLVICSKENDAGQPIADGSEKPFCILKVDIDATDADKVGIVFRTGAFLGTDLILGKGHTLAGIDPDLGLRSIFIAKGY